MKRLFPALSVLSLLASLACSGQDTTSGPWVMQESGTAASLRGIHAVGGGVAWASGTNGTVLRTEDSGYMWQSCAMPPGAEKLDFRGIWAFDSDTAIVMSSGPGDQSRLYKTADGCSHWKLMYINPDRDGFWDALQFWSREHGMLLGDPTVNKSNAKNIGPEFTILDTIDGGKTWLRQLYILTPDMDYSALKVAENAGAFAASNSALTGFEHKAWFGTGGKAGAFIFIGDRYQFGPPTMLDNTVGPERTKHIWFSHHTLVPLTSGSDAAGVFSLSFRDELHGMAVGGDYSKPNETSGTAAWSSDGDQHWTAATKPPHGYRSAVAWDADVKAWIAAGTNGSDISYDDGKTWTPLDNGNWNALSLPWIVGPHGRIAKLDEGRLKQQ